MKKTELSYCINYPVKQIVFYVKYISFQRVAESLHRTSYFVILKCIFSSDFNGSDYPFLLLAVICAKNFSFE